MKTVKGVVRCLLSLAVAAAPFSWAGSATYTFDWYKIDAAGYAADVVVDGQGNPFVGLNTSTIDNGYYTVRKFSTGGTLIWQQNLRYQGGKLSRIAADANGNVAAIWANPGQYSGNLYQWQGSFGKLSAAGRVFGPIDSTSYFYTDLMAEAPRAGVSMDSVGNAIFAFPFSGFTYAGQTWSATDTQAGILKVSPSGAVIWLKQVVGPGFDIPSGVAVDSTDNVYVSGYADSNMAFDATNLQSNGGRDSFLAKYNKDGVLQWVRRPTCSSDDMALGVAITGDGTVWFAGTFRGSITFGNSISSTSTAGYLARVDAAGNPISIALLNGITDISKLAATPVGDVLITGKFAGTSILGTTVTNQGSNDVYVAQINQSGTAQWIKTLGYIYGDNGGGAAIDKSGAVYVAASINSAVVLDGKYVAATSPNDTVLAKLINPTASQLAQISVQPISSASFLGAQASLSVTASSSVPVTYQWFKDGVALSGQTSATLSIASARPSDDANYYVEVTNQYGTVRSDSVHLVVLGDAPVVVTTIAGTNIAAFVDSTVPSAVRFYNPNSPAIQNDGAIVVPDAGNNALRILEPNGTVGTLAGKATAGLTNGPASAAYFNAPMAAAVNPAWDIFVADSFNNVIRKISAFGARTVTTYAGSGEKGFQDGSAAQAKFSFPNDIVSDASGNLFVTEFDGNRVRKIIDVNPSVTIFGVTGKTYRIESTESLLTPDWTVLGEVTLATPVETWFDTQPLTRAKRFYRAVLKN